MILDVLGLWSLYYFGVYHARHISDRFDDSRYESSNSFCIATITESIGSILLLAVTALIWVSVLMSANIASMRALELLTRNGSAAS